MKVLIFISKFISIIGTMAGLSIFLFGIYKYFFAPTQDEKADNTKWFKVMGLGILIVLIAFIV